MQGTDDVKQIRQGRYKAKVRMQGRLYFLKKVKAGNAKKSAGRFSGITPKNKLPDNAKQSERCASYTRDDIQEEKVSGGPSAQLDNIKPDVEMMADVSKDKTLSGLNTSIQALSAY